MEGLEGTCMTQGSGLTWQFGGICLRRKTFGATNQDQVENLQTAKTSKVKLYQVVSGLM